MRWAMAWICFWIGDAAYRCHLNALHQRAMVWSDWWRRRVEVVQGGGQISYILE